MRGLGRFAFWMVIHVLSFRRVKIRLRYRDGVEIQIPNEEPQ